MARWTPHAERQVPRLSPQDRRELLRAATSWRLKRQDVTEPPWVLAHPYSDVDDDAVLAAVFAAHPIAPTEAVVREPWLIRGVLRGAGDGPVLLGRVAVEHLDRQDVDVTGAVLRGIPLARIRDRAMASVRMRSEVVDMLERDPGWDVSPADIEWARRAAVEAAKLPLRLGRKGYPRGHYRRVALRAVELAGEGRRDVLEALRDEEAKRLGRYVAYDTVKRQVRRARQEFRFLAPTSQGRSDFRPGANLYRREEDDG